MPGFDFSFSFGKSVTNDVIPEVDGFFLKFNNSTFTLRKKDKYENKEYSLEKNHWFSREDKANGPLAPHNPYDI